MKKAFLVKLLSLILALCSVICVFTACENSPKTSECAHSVEILSGKEATCTEEGLTAGEKCAICGEILVAQKVIIPLEHEYVEGNCVTCGVTSTEYFNFTLGYDGAYGVEVNESKKADLPVNVKIPSTYNGLPVTLISREAFFVCESLESVIIPETITKISTMAFCGCDALTSITIPDSVTVISDFAFDGCDKLEKVIISENSQLTFIGFRAFKFCASLTTISIPDGITYVGESAFAECPRLKYNEKDYLRYLGNEGNRYLYLVGATTKEITTANIDYHCKVIGYNAFEKCVNLTSVLIRSGVVFVGRNAFSNCGIFNIYCEAESKPLAWHDEWNSGNLPVIWGYDTQSNG